MKRNIKLMGLTLLLFLLMPILVTATEYTDISHDWHPFEDSFLVDGTLYELKLNAPKIDYLKFTVDSDVYLIKQGSCKTVEDYKYCYDSYDFDNEKATISPNGDLMPGILIIIKKVKGLEVSTVTTNTDLPTSIPDLEKTPIIVTLKNTGSEWIDTLDLEITIPENMTLINNKDFIRIGDKLKVSTSLASGQEKRYSFEVKPDNYQKYKFNYSEVYESTGQTKTINDAFEFNVETPFTITSALSASTVNVGDEISYVVTLKNTNMKNALAIKKLSIKGSKQFVYTVHKKLELTKFGEYSSTEDTLDSELSDEFKLVFQPINIETSNISLEYEFEINDHTYTGEIQKTIIVKEDELKSDIYLNKKDVLPGDSVTASINLKNERQLQAYRNITISLRSELFNNDVYLDKILPSENKNIDLGTFKAPRIETDKSFDVNVTVYYKMLSDDFTFTKDFATSFKVIGSGQILKLTQTIDKTKDLKRGDIITVTVNVENLNNQFFDKVNVYDLFPRQLELNAGKTQKTDSLSSKESKQQYIYKLKIPNEFSLNSFNITSKAVIQSIGYETSTQTALSVDIPKVEPAVVDSKNKNITNDPANVIVNNKKEKDKSFFGNLISSIEDFFVGIFGG